MLGLYAGGPASTSISCGGPALRGCPDAQALLVRFRAHRSPSRRDAGRSSLAAGRPELAAPLHPSLPYTGAEVVWAARHEMARTVEDVLSRRTRMLLLDARASVEAAPLAASLLAGELGRDEEWRRAQLEAYRRLAKDYLLGPA